MNHARHIAIASLCFVAAACGGTQTADEAITPLVDETEVVEAADGVTDAPITDDPFASDPFGDDPFSAPAPEAVGDDPTARYEAIVDAVDAARTGDRRAARAQFEQLLDDPEYGGWAAYNLGTTHWYEGDADEARRWFELALERKPDMAEPLAALVRMELQDGDVAGARRLVSEQRALSDDAPEVRAVGLYIDLDEGRFEQVIRDGRDILLEDDDNLDVHYTMGTANLRLGRTELAAAIFQQGLDRDANRPDFYFGLAEIELRASNNPGARTWFERVLDIEPDHPEAWNNLGVLNLESRNYDAAIAAFETATRVAPDFAEAWMNLGSALKGAQRYAESGDVFEYALQLDPGYPDPHFNLGVLYLDTRMDGLTDVQRYQRAIDEFSTFRDAAGTLPADHRVYDYLQTAQQQYDTALQLEQDAANRGGGFEDDGFGDDGFGDDPFGDDGFGDDPFGDDGFEDDGFEDDPFGDESNGDDEDGDGEDSDEPSRQADPFAEDPFDEDASDDPFEDDPFGDDPFAQ